MVFSTVHPFDFSAVSRRGLLLLIGTASLLGAVGLALGQSDTPAQALASQSVPLTQLKR